MKFAGLLHRGLTLIAGPAGAAIATRIGQTLLALVLARSLGVEGYGFFVFVIGSAVLSAMFAGFGWPHFINRELPRLARNEDWSKLRGLNRAANISVGVASVTLAAAMLGASFIFTEFAQGLRLAAALTLPIAIMVLRQQQLVAVDRPVLSMMLDQGMAASVVLVVVYFLPLGAVGVLAAYGVAVVGLVAVGTCVVKARLPLQSRAVTPEYRWREWLASAASLFNSLLSRILVTRFDVLLVAPLAGLAEAGLFGSAFRLSLLMTFPQFILQSIITPRFGRAFAANDHNRVRKLLLVTLAFALLTTFPFLFPALLFPTLAMITVFGEEFAAGGPTLLWLAVGQCLAAIGLGLNTMIAVGGNHKAMGRQGLLISVIALASGYLTVPVYGAVGAAFVLAASNVLWVGGMAWLAKPMFTRRDKPMDPGL